MTEAAAFATIVSMVQFTSRTFSTRASLIVIHKFLSLHDADGGQLPCEFWIVRIGRLLLNVRVDRLELREVAWRIVLNDLPLASTNLVSGTGGLAASLTLLSSAVAMLVLTKASGC